MQAVFADYKSEVVFARFMSTMQNYDDDDISTEDTHHYVVCLMRGP
jgi:hypothetical protein